MIMQYLIFLPWLSKELLHIKRSLPDGVALQLMQEELCASSRFIACNDYVALAHADLHSVLS